MANIIFIDNFDSFTYNLVDEFRVLGHQVVVYRNDVDLDTITQAVLDKPNTLLALSPGPGNPSEAGNLLAIIERLKDAVPILGICLGHQAIIEAFGGTVVHAGEVMHGKVSHIKHDEQTVFKGLKNPMPVARYHSLCGTNLPQTLTVTASYDYVDDNTKDTQNIVMAVRHNRLPICGFQFHPESILTLHGSQLLKQTVDWLLEPSISTQS
ncbi:aminodeoxychorismate/anthranilate synthase component II [Psychrobacter sp. HD31]|uniref:aminodeoxychorismate/anthranilate synthase component II n=1 Tax=Psychrobacter sp. HD31 TaxID=3112003 RepID=UPI003DA29FF6